MGTHNLSIEAGAAKILLSTFGQVPVIDEAGLLDGGSCWFAHGLHGGLAVGVRECVLGAWGSVGVDDDGREYGASSWFVHGLEHLLGGDNSIQTYNILLNIN